MHIGRFQYIFVFACIIWLLNAYIYIILLSYRNDQDARQRKMIVQIVQLFVACDAGKDLYARTLIWYSLSLCEEWRHNGYVIFLMARIILLLENWYWIEILLNINLKEFSWIMLNIVLLSWKEIVDIVYMPYQFNQT